jgi:hypothetical protein
VKKGRTSERQIQTTLVEHIRKRQVPDLLWFHVPNAPRSRITGAILKAMGMRAGVSDLLFLHCGKLYALELKAADGRPTTEQLRFQADVNRAGGYAALCYGLDRALACLKTWGLIK